jgi:branched-chain amino acid transport system ATP-binding protein
VRRVYLGGHTQPARRAASGPADRKPLLEVRDLNVSYGKAQALDGVSLDVGAGLGRRTAAQIARGGIVQCPESRELFAGMTVRENLDLGGQHLSREACARQLEWLFDLFPILRSRQRQPARTLSGGEQQMLAIAHALMMQPRLLILDEPTLGLAPVTLQQLSKALDQLRRGTDITVLLGEQNVTFALPHADRVYVLEHARIVWQGPPEGLADEAGAGLL